MNWIFQPAQKLFEEVKHDWDRLNRSSHNHILIDSDFVEPLLHHFGHPGILLGISQDSQRPGMVLVEKKHPGCWQTYQPSQAPLGLVVLGGRKCAAEEVLEMMRGLPGFALQLSVLHQDPDYSSFLGDSMAQNQEVLEYLQTGRLRITGCFEDYWKTRSSDLRQNLARRLRRLEQKGEKLELVIHRSPDGIAELIKTYARMESQGWKGEEGTAITEVGAQGRFYHDVMERFCARGEGIVFQMLLNGHVIGSELYLSRDGMLVGLKTTFDESHREISPGFLMKQAIIRQVFEERKAQAIEFYGRIMDWHVKWITESRTMFHLNFFRNALVRAARGIIKPLK
jgi:hypothetical protein